MTPEVPLHEVQRPVSPPTNLAQAFDFYTALKLPVTPVRRGAKEGYKDGWSKRGPGTGESLSNFRLDDNIGVLNGTESIEPEWFFHDIDIDANSDAARQIVEQLLPPTGWRYGRSSKPRSHANYLVKGQLRTRKYRGVHGTIIELRGLTQKKTHTLSVGPGSTWVSEDKTKHEPVRFCEPLTAIGRVEIPDVLDKGVQHAAVGIIIQQDWPTNTGYRHQLRLAFAKILIEHGISPERTTDILEAVMEATKSNVADVAPTVRSTHDAIRAGQPTAGASEILEVLGEETGRAILKAIDHRRPSRSRAAHRQRNLSARWPPHSRRQARHGCR
jgi:hypothetical protein